MNGLHRNSVMCQQCQSLYLICKDGTPKHQCNCKEEPTVPLVTGTHLDTQLHNGPTQQITQSQGLSSRITQMSKDGRKLNDDSFHSEKTLNDAMPEILQYAETRLNAMGATLVYKQKLSLYECQLYFEHASRLKNENPAFTQA